MRYLYPSLLALATLLLSGLGHSFTLSMIPDPIEPAMDSGHEEITRQGLLALGALLKQDGNEILISAPKIAGGFDPDFSNMIGNTAIEMIVRANYRTDMPRGTYPDYLQPMNEYWRFTESADWNNPKAQDLHFLRNYLSDTSLASAYDTCHSARGRILQLSADAVKQWLAGETRQALAFLGTATHTIQDSFSSAHTGRKTKQDNNDIREICFYPQSGAPDRIVASGGDSVCFHESTDARDSIWLETKDEAGVELAKAEWLERGEKVTPLADRLEYDLNSESQTTRAEHLKHEARLARTATTKYLYVFFRYLRAYSPGKAVDPGFAGLRAKLTQEFFEGNEGIAGLREILPRGAFRCESLSREEPKLKPAKATP